MLFIYKKNSFSVKMDSTATVSVPRRSPTAAEGLLEYGTLASAASVTAEIPVVALRKLTDSGEFLESGTVVPRITTSDIQCDIAKTKDSADIVVVVVDDDYVTRKLIHAWLHTKYKCTVFCSGM
jgi:hypothetical protein